MDFYRFSISWSRLVPTGIVAEGINEVGIQYYHNLLELLSEYAHRFVLHFSISTFNTFLNMIFNIMLKSRKISKPWLRCIIGICLKSYKNTAAGWMIQWHSVFRSTQTYATQDSGQVWPHGSRSTSHERQHLAGMKLVTWRRGLNSLEQALTIHPIRYWEHTPPHIGKLSTVQHLIYWSNNLGCIMSVMLTSSMVKLAYHLTVIGLSQLLKVLRTRPPLIVSSSGTLVFGHIRFYMVRKMNQLLPNRMSYSCRLAHPLEWCHFSLFQVDPLGYSGLDSQSFFHHFFF